MSDGVKSKRNVHTSTPFPNRKAMDTKKLLKMTSTQEPISPIIKKSTMLQLVIKAIQSVGLPKKGASLIAIKKWIMGNSDSKPRSQKTILKKAILKGIESGTIVRAPHSKDAPGISGSFTLASKAKKVKSSPKHKAIIKKTVKSPKVKASKERVKESKSAQSTKAVKKGSKKNVKSPLKKIVGKETKKKLVSSFKAVAKKITKKPVVSSKEISEKRTKNDASSAPKRAAKNGLKNKPPSLPEQEKNLFIFTDSDGENIGNPEPGPELAAHKKANTEKVLRQEKSTKTKEQLKIKDAVSKTAVGKSENAFQPEKEKNIKHITEKSKENREPLKENNEPIKTKMIKTKLNRGNDFDVSRMSDTELDIRSNRPKSIRSYASDTELEVSRRMVPQRKQIKSERKALTKKNRKNAAETTVANTESDMDNTKTIKPENQSKLRKPKKNEIGAFLT